MKKKHPKPKSMEPGKEELTNLEILLSNIVALRKTRIDKSRQNILYTSGAYWLNQYCDMFEYSGPEKDRLMHNYKIVWDETKEVIKDDRQ